ncbi:TetR/AcrR family transcriptional regulator [Actinacidiphila oryziradicis]|uniref:Helix-turn-helix transcriptional regulator n=1 Tax=Actinacidiphila oryziradicis TaxID=2571141 RepID=A0A4U0SVW4_9ACTN|nr:TetR/AcrR family transcriptional regulator [Actinacidiphila oryziradicis]TKA04625.1 helix-turn-helix transcriptional regulator [Actinacidiphila oryziradicis]
MLLTVSSRYRRDMVESQVISAAALRLFAERGYRATTMADIGAAIGIRGPSLYRHVSSKQTLLGEIMVAAMRTLIADQRAARDAGGDVVLQLRRMVEAHVRYHAAHREQAFVGNREIGNLEHPYHDQVLRLRQTYEQGLRAVIESGCATGAFHVAQPRLASYAILDMGIGVSAWFRTDGPHSAEQVAYSYADYAIRLLTDRQPDMVAVDS